MSGLDIALRTTAACSDWPTTVDRLVSLAKLLGGLEKVAQQYNLDIPELETMLV